MFDSLGPAGVRCRGQIGVAPVGSEWELFRVSMYGVINSWKKNRPLVVQDGSVAKKKLFCVVYVCLGVFY